MKTSATVIGNLIIAGILALFGFAVLGHGGWLLLVFLGALYGCGLFTYFHYRYIRQEELLHLLSMAADADSPIGPALWAYLSDRSRGWGLDRKLERLALLLESGESLAGALRATPGLVARETVLAAAVGESSGRLAVCLRHAPRWQLATVWREVVPSLLYPLILLLFINGCFTFLMIFFAPRFEKTLAGLHIRLPELTRQVFWFGYSPLGQGAGLALALFGVALVTVLFIVSPAARWHCPGVRRLTRLHIQSRVLSMLGILLEADQPLPQALDVLADSGYFTAVAQRRLGAVRHSIEQGQELAPALHSQGLLPARMVALVQAAERMHNVPSALSELGAHLGQRAARMVRRFSMLFFPAAVLGASALVGLIALAWFLPLIKVLTELSQ